MVRDSDEHFSYTDAARNARKADISADIAHRLRRVCENLNDEEFRGLVDQMADKQIRGERRENQEHSTWRKQS